VHTSKPESVKDSQQDQLCQLQVLNIVGLHNEVLLCKHITEVIHLDDNVKLININGNQKQCISSLLPRAGQYLSILAIPNQKVHVSSKFQRSNISIITVLPCLETLLRPEN